MSFDIVNKLTNKFLTLKKSIFSNFKKIQKEVAAAPSLPPGLAA